MCAGISPVSFSRVAASAPDAAKWFRMARDNYIRISLLLLVLPRWVVVVVLPKQEAGRQAGGSSGDGRTN